MIYSTNDQNFFFHTPRYFSQRSCASAGGKEKKRRRGNQGPARRTGGNPRLHRVRAAWAGSARAGGGVAAGRNELKIQCRATFREAGEEFAEQDPPGPHALRAAATEAPGGMEEHGELHKPSRSPPAQPDREVEA